MVTRVWGHVEGVEVIFTPYDNDKWKCKIPKSLDGEYIVDLYAEDDSGNVSYTATVLFTIDAKHLTFTVKVLNFVVGSNLNQYSINMYSVSGKVKDFTLNLLRCEVCGGDMYTTR